MFGLDRVSSRTRENGCSIRHPRKAERSISRCVCRRSRWRSEEHTSELQSQSNLVCRLLLEKKKINDPAHSDRHQSGIPFEMSANLHAWYQHMRRATPAPPCAFTSCHHVPVAIQLVARFCGL